MSSGFRTEQSSQEHSLCHHPHSPEPLFPILEKAFFVKVVPTSITMTRGGQIPGNAGNNVQGCSGCESHHQSQHQPWATFVDKVVSVLFFHLL